MEAADIRRLRELENENQRLSGLCGGELGTIGVPLSVSIESRRGTHQAVVGVGAPAAGGRISEAVQAAAAAGTALESQTSASRVLQLEIEQTTQRQATIADAESGAAGSDTNDE